jgi:hypothetical protein
MIGLSRAFFVAGCPTTVASQWKVDSSSTTELMLSFHRNLCKGQSKAGLASWSSGTGAEHSAVQLARRYSTWNNQSSIWSPIPAAV